MNAQVSFKNSPKKNVIFSKMLTIQKKVQIGLVINFLASLNQHNKYKKGIYT